MDINVILMQMVQLFLVLALGYFLMMVNVIDKEFTKKLTSFILTVTTPAMIIASVLSTTEYLPLQDILFVLIIGFVLYLVLPIIGYIISKIIRTPQNQIGLYIFMSVFSNIGFMGFPVIKAIFGNDAIFYTALFNMVFNVILYTIGVPIMNYGTNKKAKFEIKNLLSPALISSLLALVIYLIKLTLPQVCVDTITTIGDMTTPLAMIIIGGTLAQIPLRDVFSEIRVYFYTFIKQIVFPICFYPILSLIIKDPLILGVTLVMVAMPVGNCAVLFATEYDGDVALAAKTVFMTTLLSILTIPLIVALFLA